MKVLVTGGAGFIGSHFVRHVLKNTDWFVVNVDCLYPCATRTLQQNIPNRYKFYHANITEEKLILSLLTLHGIDLVVHFAAQSYVDTSFSHSALHIKDNIMGTHCILEALRICHLESSHVKPRMIMISTDEVIGSCAQNDEAKTEDALMKPTNPYAASKAAAELLVGAYVSSYRLPILTVRGNNAFGPGQFAEKVIPRFILQLQKKLPITIQGDGSQQRSFLYVSDFVQAVMCVIEHGKEGKTYNIGSDYEVSISELAHKIATIMESDSPTFVYVADRPFNDARYLIQCKALQALGWRQQVSFDDGLRQTVAWFSDPLQTTNYFMSQYELPLLDLVTPSRAKRAREEEHVSLET